MKQYKQKKLLTNRKNGTIEVNVTTKLPTHSSTHATLVEIRTLYNHTLE